MEHPDRYTEETAASDAGGIGPLPSTAPPAAVVAGHVCLDLTPALHAPVTLEPGRLTEVGAAALSTGGAVGNTGVAMHRLGVGMRLMGKVGDDAFARAVLDALDGQGPGLADGMLVTPGEATSYSIVISPPGVDRSFLHCPGANDTFSADDVRPEDLTGARLLHFGYPPLMRRMYADGGAELRRMFAAAREAGVTTSLDLSRPDPDSDAGRVDWARILAGTLPFVDVVLPSIDELAFMLGESGHAVDRSLLADLAGRLIDMGVAVAAIKLGDQGLYLRTASDVGRVAVFCDRLGLDADAWRGREILSPCFTPRQVAGTTGSGDCTIAGFLAALLRGVGPAGAATAATAVGACSVEVPHGTDGVVAWPEIAARLQRPWPRLPVAIELGPAAGHECDASGTLTFASP